MKTEKYIHFRGKPEVTKQFARPNVNGRLILQWILKKYGGRMWSGFIWPRIPNN
jgi:hypothetical protein